MQAKAATAQTTQVSPALAAEIHSLRRGGQPLDPATRNFMEPRFGHDFSQVRIHTNARAAKSARAIGAKAYTVGQDIVFDDDFYAPDTTEGRHLFAHELVHVLQQRSQTLTNEQSVNVTETEMVQGAANPVLIAALAVLAATAACGLPFHQYALSTYGHKTDKWRHCWVSCEMSKTCGPIITELAGLGKEIRDRAVAVFCDYYPSSDACKGGHSDFWDSLKDLAANQACIAWESALVGPISRFWRQSCKDCCDEAGL